MSCLNAGFYASKEKSQASGCRCQRVLISASAGNDLRPSYGVNHETLTLKMGSVRASLLRRTTSLNGKALADYEELLTGFMTTIHAYTGNQKILDAPDGGLNSGGRGSGNPISFPLLHRAAQAIGNVIQSLGKLIGSAQGVQ